MFDSAQIAGNIGELLVAASGVASVQMSDSPTIKVLSGSPSAPMHANLTSMFQTSSTALKLERLFGFKVLRDTAVASIEGIDYASSGSP
jgi:hypothetical protein